MKKCNRKNFLTPYYKYYNDGYTLNIDDKIIRRFGKH